MPKKAPPPKQPPPKAARRSRSGNGSAAASGPAAADPAPSANRAAPAIDVTRRGASAAASAAIGASRRALGGALGGALGATPSIVIKAAAIIEEEVAMGIGAAKRIEQRFLDVAALRAQPADAVMSKFRHDAHEAIDIIIDIVTAAAAAAGDRAGRFINVTASHTGSVTKESSAPESAVRMPTVRVPGVVAAGTTAQLTMSLENESDQATAEFTLHAGELVSASGARIPSDHVRFEPATVVVAPRAASTVTVHINVPAGTPAGSYEGLVRATQLDGLKAVLAVTVG